MSSDRLERDDLFMAVARLYAARATCARGRVGAVAVRDGRIVASGYNGAPSGQPHCIDTGCILDQEHCVRSIHAESNLIAWAARTGTELDDTYVFSTTQPCLACSRLLVNAGVVGVTFEHGYNGLNMELIDELGLETRLYEPAS